MWNIKALALIVQKLLASYRQNDRQDKNNMPHKIFNIRGKFFLKKYLEVCLEVQGSLSFPPGHKNNLHQCEWWFFDGEDENLQLDLKDDSKISKWMHIFLSKHNLKNNDQYNLHCPMMKQKYIEYFYTG